jgi:SAM-dependent methyltransferase
VNPYQLAIGQTISFLTDVLHGRQRVLEVGCGRGDVARRLGASGFHVTALDVQLPDPSPSPGVAFVERDFLYFDAPPFDAIVFTASLHHISPLAAAIDRAYRLLVPGGLLVADDFDLEAPNVETLRWYYDIQDLLAAAELFSHEHVDPHPGAPHGSPHAAHHGSHHGSPHAAPPTGAPDGDVVQRWRAAHTHDPPLHTGVQMRRAIAERFDLHDVHGAAYLYRYITKHLPQDARGLAVAQHMYMSERRGIAEGTLTAVGLGIVAVRS